MSFAATGTTISGLPAATDLAGDELAEVVQAGNKRSTVDAIAKRARAASEQGPVVLATDPAEATHAARRGYVDASLEDGATRMLYAPPDSGAIARSIAARENATGHLRAADFRTDAEATAGTLNAALGRALDAKTARNAPVVIDLPPGDFAWTQVVQRTSLAGSVHVRGAGKDLTRLSMASALSTAFPVRLGAGPIGGAFAVSWPTDNPKVFSTENHYTVLAADAPVGAIRVTLGNVADVLPGDLLSIKSARLWLHDNRNQVMFGEVVRVRSVGPGNDVELYEPIALGYRAGIIYSGTLAGGTLTTAVLPVGAAGLTSDGTFGCLMRVISGTNAGQQRYINSYDQATRTATFTTGSDFNDQSVWPAALDATSVVEIVATPYVSVTHPATVILEGLTLDCAGSGVQSGLAIQGCVRPELRDVRVNGARGAGAYFIRCWKPKFIGCTIDDATSVNSTLGYATGFQECRDVEVFRHEVYNCRRATDFLGFFPTVRGIIHDFFVDGGEKGTGGADWETLTQSGIGGHGQSFDIALRNGKIGNIGTAIVVRGYGWTVEDVEINGEAKIGVYVSHAGGYTRIRRIKMLRRISPRMAPVLPPQKGERRLIYVLGNTMAAGSVVDVDDCQADWLTAAVEVETQTANAAWRLFLKGCELDFNTADTAFLIDGNEIVRAQKSGWEVYNNRVVQSGVGGLVGLTRLSAVSDGTSGIMRVGDYAYDVQLADDQAVSIALASYTSNQVWVRVHPVGSSNSVVFNGVLRSGYNAAVVSYSTAVGCGTPVGPLTGTTGTDGLFNLAVAGARLWLENRTGSGQQLRVVLDVG
ncbi:hypothetical protein [Falsiroseomonas tokyonensis]|uniref:Uncharacterized protein n=1 Tax=Falsiroseomonas tokyonensis TaxID=430521 RepID=A0ABV7C158_9PROT|nr:hypothetical protein [Falsiroseomonas tokyonensis]MBU8540800.1 hypothetical protein [Falsiroseomonas tokyonensis]